MMIQRIRENFNVYEEKRISKTHNDDYKPVASRKRMKKHDNGTSVDLTSEESFPI